MMEIELPWRRKRGGTQKGFTDGAKEDVLKAAMTEEDSRVGWDGER